MRRCARRPRLALAGALLALAPTACEFAPAAPPAPPVPGAIVRRLTQFEYENTIRDVLGVEAALAREFPSDPPALGFDTVAAAQATSALLVQVYQRSAEAVADLALRDPTARAALLVCEPDTSSPDDACLHTILDTLVTRAWRRPPTARERTRLLALYARGRGRDHGLRLVLEAVLLSPHFAFRWERDLAPPGESHWLDDHALAVRLSYFLWSSAPDDELLALAAAGALHDPDVLEQQVLRMLADPRSAGFIDGFAGQWLDIRGLHDIFRDAHRYPQFDEALRASMREALRRRFAEFLVPGRDFRELLTDTRAHVDARLAALYRLDDAPDDFTRLDLGPHKRRGLLTEPGLLAVLAYPFASAPTRRGRFVLERLLCAPLPPPPPGAADVVPADAPTARERLAVHRANPACAGCHATLDPIGLSFEHYDAIGAWRGSEHGELIDAAGELPTGETFADVRELAEIVADDPRFPRCVARNVMTYALGRELTPEDDDALDDVHTRFVEQGHDLVALLVAVAKSDPFRARRTQDRAP